MDMVEDLEVIISEEELDMVEDLEQLQKYEKRDIPPEGFEAVCWGCGLRLLLLTDVPKFKCGWCGAISSQVVQSKTESRCLKCSRASDRIFVTVVLLLIILIICGGSWAVFPVLYPDFSFGFYLNLVITVILSFNTLFNYCVSAFVRAGPLPHVIWGSFDYITKGSLEGYRFCHVCNKPKPPGAHHCRACEDCVLEMDHHCPFIGNCVGAANQRPFILFLLFAVLSNIYVLLMSIPALLKIWSSLMIYSVSVEVTSSSWSVMQILSSCLQVIWRNLGSSSVRALGILYLIAVSLSITIGVGVLLHQQLRQLYNGLTFIDSIQFESGVVRGALSSRGWINMQRIFGTGHPIFWIFPKLVSYTNVRKVHEK